MSKKNSGKKEGGEDNIVINNSPRATSSGKFKPGNVKIGNNSVKQP